MALTRSFRETFLDRAQRDPRFRSAMLREGVEALLAGEVTLGKTILRDYINATIGFEMLARETSLPAKSLMRMMGPKGNPRADNLFHIIHRLQAREGVAFSVATRRA